MLLVLWTVADNTDVIGTLWGFLEELNPHDCFWSSRVEHDWVQSSRVEHDWPVPLL